MRDRRRLPCSVQQVYLDFLLIKFKFYIITVFCNSGT